MINLLSQPLLALMAAGAGFFLIAALLGSFKVIRAETAEREHLERLALLPARDDLAAANAELVFRKEELTKLDGEINGLRAERAEIRRHALDAQHYEAMAKSAKEAYENLGEKITAVDKVRDDYDEATKKVAEIQTAIDDLIRKRDTLQKEIGDIEERRDEAEKLSAELDGLRNEREQLKEEIAQIEDVRDERERARIGLDQLNRLKSEMERDIEALPDEINALTDKRDGLQVELEDLLSKREESRELDEILANSHARKEALITEIERLEAHRNGILPMGGGGDGRKNDATLTDEEIEAAVSDLWVKPSCLFDKSGLAILTREQEQISEKEALQEVQKYLAELGLHFDDSRINRFHTSLKISRVSPLTVLAGISGTGKSLLPQRYAEAMGIPFLKVAVQPRWDSPQDLLGFYNYLEKKYKATDLARALAYVDPRSHNTDRIDDRMDDRMLMILMDEMNLARIEYYFSEFLSRLENRPNPGVTKEAQLRTSRIEIDVPVVEGREISIYPGHNTLFVGTMNEDESTQSLSDKVLDRGNAIRFKEPGEFKERIDDGNAMPSERYLSFETWQSWYVQSLPDDKKRQLKENVEKLEAHLVNLGRPFGHRIFHAIAAYAANHPDQGLIGSENRALVEMMEMRVLPKLRGIELDTRESEAVQSIANFVSEDLGDETGLAGRIISSMGDDGMFTWKG